jgi:hypothetical protein
VPESKIEGPLLAPSVKVAPEGDAVKEAVPKSAASLVEDAADSE